MLFTEPLFFLFFATVFCGYWWLAQGRSRKVWLLVASYAFYASWDWRFLGLVWASTLIDYCAGLGMAAAATRRTKKSWLMLSLVGNLGMLGFFKYFNFFIETANPVLTWVGQNPMRNYEILLPIGISFYTLQTLSYSIDVYRGKMRATRDFLDFALFVGFFPQLVMGPILRALGFMPQLAIAKHFSDVRFKALLALFLIGFFKKTCVSDNIAPIVDAVYADPLIYSNLGIWIAVLFYSIQLYCDFSAYSDMAIALSGMLGYAVPLNFDFPFLARNVSDFWRRWHISFSFWIRDYLYIPMGGSRGGARRTELNLMIMMLISGLWHGAGFNFIMWGALSGLGLVVHRIYRNLEGVPALLRSAFAFAGVGLTLYWFSLTLIFFRAESLDVALPVVRAFAAFQSVGFQEADPRLLLWLLPLAGVHWLSKRTDFPTQAERLPDWAYSLLLGFAVAFSLAFVRLEYRPFIYFQF